MTTKHTPTPWYFELDRDSENKKVSFFGAGSELIFEYFLKNPMQSGFESIDDKNRGNAAFIVKACNYHDRLILALKEAALVMRDIGDLHGYDYIGDCQRNKDTVFTRIIKLIQEVSK